MPKDIRIRIASKAKARRLFLNISQKELADRSGVSLGSIKRFESNGQISLSSLLELAFTSYGQ
ncbi:helix-turn-helix transcriptional regulator [Desulfovibrio sp. OttesenSCG-928-C06]|nr:helix-turn-helix transcriptional regulator [Desulfovibrio sp. OttesenSCG-928-C06]